MRGPHGLTSLTRFAGCTGHTSPTSSNHDRTSDHIGWDHGRRLLGTSAPIPGDAVNESVHVDVLARHRISRWHPLRGGGGCPTLALRFGNLGWSPSQHHHSTIASLLYGILLYTLSIGHRGFCVHRRDTRERRKNRRDVRQPERAQGPRARRRVRDSAEALDVDSSQAHCRFRCVLMTGLKSSIPRPAWFFSLGRGAPWDCRRWWSGDCPRRLRR